ncbi:phytoene synthase/lycopene cyclase [Chlamydoabsidia padenii]|nr:phytoene synthase/lycopene cyclase [Chlamydoabsidia padenii]
MLTYMEVHLYYTLPVLYLLLVLLRPLYNDQDRLKYIFLCGMAILTGTCWDNYVAYYRAWWYCPTSVTLVIGYVPLEGCMSYAVLTLITVSFTNLVMRWHLPALHLLPWSSRFHSICIRFIPMVALMALAIKSWFVAIPEKPLFYGACILCYTCPALAFLWFGSGEYICRRWKGVLISIIIPTVYLCWVDKMTIDAGIRRISERSSTRYMVVTSLPVEESMLVLLVNMVLVFASCAIDRAYTVVHLYRGSQESSWWYSAINLVQAFCLSDQQLDSQLLDDLRLTWRILKDCSASFHTASAVFSPNARQDLGVLYAFCRVTDDLADNEQIPVTVRKQQLEVVRLFVIDLFTQKSNCTLDMDWAVYGKHLPDECLAAFRSFVRLRHMLQVEAVLELLDGYTWDLERRQVVTDSDLIRYSECVASSVGEMCTRILMNNNSDGLAWTIDRARDMGLVLQFTNIARDIVTDSQQLGRCYLPTTWLKDNEIYLIKTGRARQLGDRRLKDLSLRLVHAADSINLSARRGIHRLPLHSQGGVRAACAVYCAIGKALKNEQDGYPTRAHVKGYKRAWIAFQSVYNISFSTK